MGLSSRILIGLLAGIATGLFFGEMVADLKVVGDVFVKLLQMTVLPYIVVSLIAGFGRMTLPQARLLAVRGSIVLGTIWLIALALIFSAPLAFPELDQASFFASPDYPTPGDGDLISQYVPANIFYSLSNDLIPAVVLFSILMGVALISVKDKTQVLPIFDGLTEALGRINALIIQLTPFGIFAIAAAAAGTMTIEELGRVQVYLVTYIAIAVLVTFWIFPALVAALSGIPYRDVLDTFKDALMTAFATGNQLVVLPLIAENCKSLLARNGIPEEETAATIDVIVPVSFNFPSLGKMLVILFVLFAAWFTDTEISVGQYAILASNGLLSLFGSITVAVPYMLDTLQVPIDMFQLFLVTGVVVGRFGAMLAALHIIVLSVLGTLAMCGKLQLQWRPVLRYLAISIAATLVLLLTLRTYFTLFVPEPPPRSEVLQQLILPEELVDTRLSSDIPPSIDTGTGTGTGRLQSIVDRGVLRVGYRPQNLPCTFREGERVVGFDADMAQSLARDLDVSLEWAPFSFDKLGEHLDAGKLDIAMSCIASLPDRHLQSAYSESYLDLKLAVIVPDHLRRTFFNDAQELRGGEGLSVALVGSHYFEPLLHQVFPEIEIVELESAEAFFSSPEAPADALVLSAEEGAAYTFRHPNYTLILPTERRIMIPAAYALPRGEGEWKDFIDSWINLKRKDGSIEREYEFWMQGGAAKVKGPRWSIIRDVLGWVD